MTYLYTLFGITAWVAMIAFSSNALISYENGKQAESAKASINKINQQVSGTKSVIPSTTQVTTETQQSTPEIVSQPATVTPKTTVKVITPQKQVPEYESDEEDD